MCYCLKLNLGSFCHLMMNDPVLLGSGCFAMPVGSSWPTTASIPEPSKPISGIRGAAMSNLKIYEVPLSRAYRAL